MLTICRGSQVWIEICRTQVTEEIITPAVDKVFHFICRINPLTLPTLPAPPPGSLRDNYRGNGLPALTKQFVNILPEHNAIRCIKEPLMYSVGKTQAELGSCFLNIKTDKHRIAFTEIATITGSSAGIDAVPAMAAGPHRVLTVMHEKLKPHVIADTVTNSKPVIVVGRSISIGGITNHNGIINEVVNIKIDW